MAGRNGVPVVVDGEEEDLSFLDNPIPVERNTDAPEGKDRSDKGEDKRGDKGRDKDSVTLSKKDHESLLKRISEVEQESRFWADKAKGSERNQPNKGKEDDEQDDDDDAEDFKVDEALASDPDKLVDAIAREGVGALKKAGFLSAADVKKLMGKAMAKLEKVAIKTAKGVSNANNEMLRRDMKLMQEFPGLADESSELTALTTKHLKDLTEEDPSLVKSPAILRTAAKLAKAEMEAKKGKDDDDEPAPRRRGRADDDDDDADTRYRRQAGDRGDRARGSAADDEDGDEGLSPMQLQFAKRMGITDKEFKEQRAALGPARRKR